MLHDLPRVSLPPLGFSFMLLDHNGNTLLLTGKPTPSIVNILIQTCFLTKPFLTTVTSQSDVFCPLSIKSPLHHPCHYFAGPSFLFHLTGRGVAKWGANTPRAVKPSTALRCYLRTFLSRTFVKVAALGSLRGNLRNLPRYQGPQGPGGPHFLLPGPDCSIRLLC